MTDRWESAALTRKRAWITSLPHPEVGRFRLAFETLELPDADRRRLVIYLPADKATAVPQNGR
ncbi:MAG: hypothetical protein ACR2J5_01630 [Geodermatophilaceae bacterium]